MCVLWQEVVASLRISDAIPLPTEPVPQGQAGGGLGKDGASSVVQGSQAAHRRVNEARDI